MLHRLALLAAILVLAGCQSSNPPPRVTAPPPSDSNWTRSKPLPPENAPPLSSAGRDYRTSGPYRYHYGPGSTPSRQYAYAPSHGPTAPPATPHRTPPAPPRKLAPAPHVSPESHAWIPSASPRAWRWVVIHHSDTDNGSAASFGRYHRQVRHWDELGYHFVIDNGNGGPDGRVEVGPRWKEQKWGAHAGVEVYNDYGIGICLVGNFNATHPSSAQMRSLAHLTAWLTRTYHIPLDHVIGHRDAKHTDCPGRNLSLVTIRHMVAQYAGLPDLPAVASSKR